MKKEREFKVIVKNPPTEKQKEEMIKRVEEYLALVYSSQKQKNKEDKEMKKYRLNEDKLLRNIFILSTVVTVGLIVYKVATCGVSFFSTIGYFGQKGGTSINE